MISSDLRKKVDVLMARRDLLHESLAHLQGQKLTAEKRHLASLKAREILHTIAQNTQKNVEQGISNIVSLALNAVFEDPYQFKIEFVKRRNKMECDLFLENNGQRMHPMDSVGGGVLNIISFALQLSFVMLGRFRKVLILDEPMRFLSQGYRSKAAEMLSLLSERLGMQIIMATHIPEFIEQSDRNFQITSH